jgi:hypothetical protein
VVNGEPLICCGVYHLLMPGESSGHVTSTWPGASRAA